MTPTSATVLLNRLHAKARIRHLQVLVALGELRSLKRTAEFIGLSQPAVTQLLADLESLLETRLFDRLARGVRPTPAGADLLPTARRILDAVAEGSEVITARKLEGEGTVRIAAIAGAMAGLLVRAIPAFAAHHPSVQVTVMESGADESGLLFTRGQVDLVACREPRSLPAGAVFMPILEDRFVIACGTGHPLAGRHGVGWRTLARETWLPSPVGSAARETFDRVLMEASVTPKTCDVIARVPALTWAMLSSQRLLTLAPYGVVRQLVEAGQLALIEPPERLPFTPIGLLVPEDGASTAARRFVDFVAQRRW